MRLSISRSRESIWVWLFWGLGIYLALEAGPFLIAKHVLRKTTGELAGPYLAFAVPWAILAPIIWWLRKWEEKGVTPKRLARGWGASMVLFVVAVGVAVFYSGVKFGFISPIDAEVSFVSTALFGGLIVYFRMYHLVLTNLSAKAAGKLEGAGSK